MLDEYAHFERRIERSNLIVAVSAVAITAFVHSPFGALSLAVGCAISWVNFHWLKQAVNFVILKGAEQRVGRRVMAEYAGRYALIGLALYASIRFTLLDPALLLAGLFSYVLAILLECIVEIGRSLFRADPDGRT